MTINDNKIFSAILSSYEAKMLSMTTTDRNSKINLNQKQLSNKVNLNIKNISKSLESLEKYGKIRVGLEKNKKGIICRKIIYLSDGETKKWWKKL